jgi:hypothetical protein
LYSYAAKKIVGKLLDALEEDLPGLFGDYEKPFGGALEVNRIGVDSEFFRKPNRLAATRPEHFGNGHD